MTTSGGGCRNGVLTLDDVADLAANDPDHRYQLQEGNLLVCRRPMMSMLN